MKALKIAAHWFYKVTISCLCGSLLSNEKYLRTNHTGQSKMAQVQSNGQLPFMKSEPKVENEKNHKTCSNIEYHRFHPFLPPNQLSVTGV